MTIEHYNVLIIGAGISGIGAARYLGKHCPDKSVAILEAKSEMGGTWNLFRYPGIRSDSDMHTMGYAFKPWKNPKAISDGQSILDYIRETAVETGADKLIRYNHKVTQIAWSTQDARWTVTVDCGEDGEKQYTCDFYFSCPGYYKHAEGYLPDWEGYESYKGQLVHPQFWPEDLDYENKRVLIIGSGATAVTLTPELAKKAAKVIQLQRTPTYVITRPSHDKQANALKKWLPATLAYHIVRWRNVMLGRIFARKFVKDIKGIKAFFLNGVKSQLPKDYDVKKHFEPPYLPGQQRICMVTDGDMFKAIRDGKAEMVTDDIECFTEKGVRTKSGEDIEADIIITATGLVLEFMGGVQVSVDGQPIDPSKLLIYKGFMYSNLPNLIYFTGYTNASWTLKVDLVADFACRLLKRMDAHKARYAMAKAVDDDFARMPPPNPFISGYVTRAAHRLPRFGDKPPWQHEQNYIADIKMLRFGKIEDGVLGLYDDETSIQLPPRQQADSDQDSARSAAE